MTLASGRKAEHLPSCQLSCSSATAALPDGSRPPPALTGAWFSLPERSGFLLLNLPLHHRLALRPCHHHRGWSAGAHREREEHLCFAAGTGLPARTPSEPCRPFVATPPPPPLPSTTRACRARCRARRPAPLRATRRAPGCPAAPSRPPPVSARPAACGGSGGAPTAGCCRAGGAEPRGTAPGGGGRRGEAAGKATGS